MRQQLSTEGARLHALLTRHGFNPDGDCALFQWVCTPRAATLHDALARQGILTRLFAKPASLRFGLPGSDADWVRLEAVLRGLVMQHHAEAVS